MCDVCALAAEARAWHDGRLRGVGCLGPGASAPAPARRRLADDEDERTAARVSTLKSGRAWLLVVAFMIVNHLVPGGMGAVADALVTAVHASPPTGPALLGDDFSEPSERWIVHTGDDDRYDYENGEYAMTLSPWSTAIEIQTSTGLAAADYQLDVDARLLPASAIGSYVVLGVRTQRDGASYRAAFDPYARTVEIYEIQGWGSTRSASPPTQAGSPLRTTRQTSAAFYRGTALNRYSLRARGDQVTALVNGKEVVSVSDAALREGGIVIGVGHAPGGLADVRFDNLLVTGLPALTSEDGLADMAGDL